jgi:Zn-dependent M28 family amino/carboxypeptidase
LVFRPSRSVRAITVAATLATATALTLSLSTTATARPDDHTRSDRLQNDVTLEGVMRHLEAFQEIADANDGNRAAGLPGYAASADYVADRMRRAGYRVQMQEFPFDFFRETAPPVFEKTAPDPVTYLAGEDFATMTFSATGNVTAPVQAVDLAPANAPETSTSGCETADFDGFTGGNIALIQRGTCEFGLKARNATAAGAVGVVIFNQGNGEDRSGLLEGTLGEGGFTVPVIGTTYAIGQELAADGTAVHIQTQTVSDRRTTTNVIAESRRGASDNVVMLGAHLDSVPAGPGLNDNGSGSAGILEVAEEMAEVRPKNKLRFAWWGAEELSLVGSTHYVDSLTPAQRADIALYLNFDMIGSSNFIRGVYDGDGDDFGLVGPPGSDAIEAMFEKHFAGKGLPSQGTEFSGRSDYQAFIENDIPAGGLFTGADGVKTEAEETMYGGVAGSIYDPCYHETCDSSTPVADGGDREVYAELFEENDLDGNIAPEALDTNADAIAHAAITYAYDTSSVNGVATASPATKTSAAHARGAHLHGVVKR